MKAQRHPLSPTGGGGGGGGAGAVHILGEPGLWFDCPLTLILSPDGGEETPRGTRGTFAPLS